MNTKRGSSTHQNQKGLLLSAYGSRLTNEIAYAMGYILVCLMPTSLCSWLRKTLPAAALDVLMPCCWLAAGSEQAELRVAALRVASQLSPEQLRRRMVRPDGCEVEGEGEDGGEWLGVESQWNSVEFDKNMMNI